MTDVQTVTDAVYRVDKLSWQSNKALYVDVKEGMLDDAHEKSILEGSWLDALDKGYLQAVKLYSPTNQRPLNKIE